MTITLLPAHKAGFFARFWAWISPQSRKVANKFRYREVLTPSRLELVLITLSAGFTVLVSIYGDELRQWKVGSLAFRYNEWAKDESLRMHVALPWVVGSLIPFSIAAFLAAISPPSSRRAIAHCLYRPMDFAAFPEQFPPDRWLNCPEGIRLFLWIGDVLCAKVGASIAGTVFGICVYLLIMGGDAFLLTFASLAVCYAFCLFPKWVRSILVRRYALEYWGGDHTRWLWRRELRAA